MPHDIGLIANDKNAAVQNTQRLTLAIAQRRTPVIPAGTFYVQGAIETPATVGCGRIATEGCRSYPVDGHSTLTGQIARLVQLGKGPIFRVNGHGFTCDDPMELVGDGESAAIEIANAKPVPNTGGHYSAHLTFQNWGACFRACGHVSDKNQDLHADNTLVVDCHSYNCRRLFWSQNQQAANWKFRDCSLNLLGANDKSVIAADIERGGNVSFTGLVISHPWCTLFRVGEFNPVNTPRLVCHEFERDRMPAETFPGNYLTVMDYAGPANRAQDYRWRLDVTGQLLTFLAPLDWSQLYKVPSSMPRGAWRVKLDEN